MRFLPSPSEQKLKKNPGAFFPVLINDILNSLIKAYTTREEPGQLKKTNQKNKLFA
jgi:hypothetical protein